MAELMFKLARERRIFWPVGIDIPQDDGETVKGRIFLQFHLLRRSDLESEAWQRVVAGQVGDKESLDLVLGRVTGWKAVLDEDDNPAAFSPEGLNALIEDLFVRPVAIARALVQASLGAPAKN